MVRTPDQRVLARRAAEDAAAGAARPARSPAVRRILRHGVAALAVSVLGLGAAGSIAVTGSAQEKAPSTSGPDQAELLPAVQVVRVPGVAQPDAFDHRAERVTRSLARPPLTTGGSTALRAAVRVRLTELTSRSQDAQNRADALAAKAKAKVKAKAKAKAKEKKQERARRAARAERRERKESRRAVLPVHRYTVAARFGQVGAWSRYHTGFDFSAPVGTEVVAPTSGKVTTAGSGPAGGWAGTYVVIKHADGISTLYAHLSSVSVRVGDTVTSGQPIGRVGMTGRSFGPHLHFEVYPSGVEPDDVYQAVDPAPWLNALGLRP